MWSMRRASRSFSANTYKIGGTWAPIDAIKFRGNYQQAVRAPNIAELFTPVVTGLTALSHAIRARVSRRYVR